MRQHMEQALGVVGTLKDRALSLELFTQRPSIDEVSIVREGHGAVE